MFLRLCQSQRLNPFTRDAYIVKYGNQPASVIAGKDAFVKRATRNKRYRGHEAGITVVRRIKRNQNSGVETVIDRREGSMLLKDEELIGGWCKVHLDGYECPIYDEVALSEYSAPDKYGKNGWSRMPATMIRKVALCHALREAFPEDLGGLYGAEEMGQAEAGQEQDGQAPARPQKAEPMEVVVEDVPESGPAQEDPRRTLWDEVAKLKAKALAYGTAEDAIRSWMRAHITDADGDAKETREYAPEDVARLRDYLAANVADHERLLQEQTPEDAEYEVVDEPDLADHDIEF